MAYQDPGTTIGEAVQPRAGAASGQTFAMVIIGEGSIVKYVVDEPHIRGQILGEPLTVAATSPYTATLLDTSTEKQQDTVVYKNGAALPNSAWSFNSATQIVIADTSYTSGAAYTIDYIATNVLIDDLNNSASQQIQELGLFPGSANFKQGVDFLKSGDTIDWGVTAQASFTGANAETFNTSTDNKIKIALNGLPALEITVTSGTAETAAQMVTDINAALAASGNYGAAYNAVASATSDHKVMLTCPSVTPYIGQESSIVFLQPSSADATNLIFGISAYPVTYTGTGVNVPAMFTGLAGPFDTTTNSKIKLQLNGLTALEITLTSGAARTSAQVASDINTALNGASQYGAAYANVASASGAQVLLALPNTAPYKGAASTITFLQPSSADATPTVFGISAYPVTYAGTGKVPAVGTQYYVSYTYTRPNTDYNVLKSFFSDKDYYADIGNVDQSNPLSIGGYIAWKYGLPILYAIQVQDADGDGIYTDTDYINAISVLVDQKAVTDITCLKSTPLIRANIENIVLTESSQSQSNFKRYWCGVPRGMASGDVDTPETIVYIAQAELTQSATSVGRGRFIICAPTKFNTTITQQDGSQPTVELDSNYRAVADAARSITLPNVSDSLLKRTLTGLVQEEAYESTERKYLTSNGVSVSTVAGAVITLFDPVTNDISGNIEFQEISTSVQKDNISFNMVQAMDDNIVGVVPDDLADFIGSIKEVAGDVLLTAIEEGQIGKYKNADGTVRDIDYTLDIVAFISATDPTKYYFRYWYNLKYPAKRISGLFSVDSPFSLSIGA